MLRVTLTSVVRQRGLDGHKNLTCVFRVQDDDKETNQDAQDTVVRARSTYTGYATANYIPPLTARYRLTLLL